MLNVLLAFIPVAIALHWFGAHSILVFTASPLALILLARLTCEATDALASYLGPIWGSVLSAGMGNAPEIILSLFALRRGLVGVVKASLAGSMIGNLLLALGASMFLGGLRHGTQSFNAQVAGMNGSLLMMTATALIIPATFYFSVPGRTQPISMEISVVLFTVYLASLACTLATRKPAAGLEAARAECEPGPPPPPGGSKHWSRKKALGILVVVTCLLAVVSEILTDAIRPATRSLGLTPIFAGVMLLPLAGNVAEMYNAVNFARADKMDRALGLTVGSSIQVALVLAPILVFGGYFFKCDMDLLFNRFEIIAIAFAVLLTRHVTVDGESNWLEGLLLVAVYLMLGFGFYYLPAQADTR